MRSPFFGDDIDDAADSAAAVAHGAAALGDFDVVDSPDAGQAGQIDAAPAIAGALGIGQTLTVDEDQDPVVAIELDVRRDARHHFIDGHAGDALQGLLDRRIVMAFHILGRNDCRVGPTGRRDHWTGRRRMRRSFRVDDDLLVVLDLRHDENACGARVDTTLRLGDGHALHAVHATLVLQVRPHALVGSGRALRADRERDVP